MSWAVPRYGMDVPLKPCGLLSNPVISAALGLPRRGGVNIQGHPAQRILGLSKKTRTVHEVIAYTYAAIYINSISILSEEKYLGRIFDLRSGPLVKIDTYHSMYKCDGVSSILRGANQRGGYDACRKQSLWFRVLITIIYLYFASITVLSRLKKYPKAAHLLRGF
jgi:hypothetical protein